MTLHTILPDQCGCFGSGNRSNRRNLITFKESCDTELPTNTCTQKGTNPLTPTRQKERKNRPDQCGTNMATMYSDPDIPPHSSVLSLHFWIPYDRSLTNTIANSPVGRWVAIVLPLTSPLFIHFVANTINTEVMFPSLEKQFYFPGHHPCLESPVKQYTHTCACALLHSGNLWKCFFWLNPFSELLMTIFLTYHRRINSEHEVSYITAVLVQKEISFFLLHWHRDV